jgi:hypothetical protein
MFRIIFQVPYTHFNVSYFGINILIGVGNSAVDTKIIWLSELPLLTDDVLSIVKLLVRKNILVMWLVVS